MSDDINGNLVEEGADQFTESDLPAGFALGRREELVSVGRFIVSILAPWLPLKLTLTTTRLVGSRPNTLFGLIPVGTRKINYPLRNVASVATDTEVVGTRVVLALLLVFIGLLIADSTTKAVLIALALLLAMDSYRVRIAVTNNGGQTVSHRVSAFSKTSALAFCDDVNEVISELDGYDDAPRRRGRRR